MNLNKKALKTAVLVASIVLAMTLGLVAICMAAWAVFETEGAVIAAMTIYLITLGAGMMAYAIETVDL